MLTPDELTTLRIQIGHHKCVSKVVAISVERMESLFEMIDAQAAKIAELEQRGDHFLAACRRAVLALAAASQDNAAYRADYEAMDRAIRGKSLANPCASQAADSEPQVGLRRNGEAQECHCNACHKEKLAANPPADRTGSLMALASRGMVLCPTCGNKRCPHANDHRNACTGSNEPGQVGSAYAVANIPADFLLVQRNPDKAVCLDGSRFHGWLMYRHPDGQFVTERKLEPWELMQAEDQRHYGIVLDGAAAQKGGAG